MAQDAPPTLNSGHPDMVVDVDDFGGSGRGGFVGSSERASGSAQAAGRGAHQLPQRWRNVGLVAAEAVEVG